VVYDVRKTSIPHESGHQPAKKSKIKYVPIPFLSKISRTQSKISRTQVKISGTHLEECMKVYEACLNTVLDAYMACIDGCQGTTDPDCTYRCM